MDSDFDVQAQEMLPFLAKLAQMQQGARPGGETGAYIDPITVNRSRMLSEPWNAMSGPGGTNMVHFMGGLPFPVQSEPRATASTMAFITNLLDSLRVAGETYKKRKRG